MCTRTSKSGAAVFDRPGNRVALPPTVFAMKERLHHLSNQNDAAKKPVSLSLFAVFPAICLACLLVWGVVNRCPGLSLRFRGIVAGFLRWPCVFLCRLGEQLAGEWPGGRWLCGRAIDSGRRAAAHGANRFHARGVFGALDCRDSVFFLRRPTRCHDTGVAVFPSTRHSDDVLPLCG